MCLKILFCLIIYLVWFSKSVSNENDNEVDSRIAKINIEPRIVGGYRPTNGSLAKYMVSIRLRFEASYNFGELHFCAGIILTSNKILTAAHCVYKNNYLLKLKIVAKTPKRLQSNQNTQIVNVRNIIIHPGFDPDKKINDIAILTLKQNIKLDNKSASTIPLPTADVIPGELCQVAGWGRLFEHGPCANEILHTSIHVHTDNQCLQISLDDQGTRFCGSYFFDEAMDACMGDSGGPIVCRGELTGIVSFGYDCGWAASGVYTNVYRYLDWIKRNGQTLFKPCLLTIGVNLILIMIAF